MNVYETEPLLAQYLMLHYGAPEEVLPYAFGPKNALDFPRRCVEDLVARHEVPSGARALDVGCSVGRTSFELARVCEEVIGIDFSASFINAANTLREKAQLDYTRPHEGAVTLRSVAAAPENVDRTRIAFETGDAMDLRPDLGTFDVVLACNLICRLPEPMRFLSRLKELVKPGGQLIITTPFSWMEEYTPRENWLGGCEGKSDSFLGLKHALQPDFELQLEHDMPMLIKEHARKYQWTVVQGSRWLRRNT
ncbi:putative 4-mercaptohistidine N1-methyltransferase [Cerasicoccus arenae]|nr:putative 4-mercaptohistidine N1-methyltransferase [Cerasicoccus arenae]MBK1859523.1 putative 4-mercaptohistidine N1-methyltransferase [Cerasicoccus arenae]